MRIGSVAHTYEWVDGWAKVPDTPSARSGWAHHGVVVTGAGDVVAFHSGDPTVLVFDGDGNLKRSWDTDLTEAHGMTLVKENGSEYIWFADSGSKRIWDAGYERKTAEPQVVKTDLNGHVVTRLPSPEHSVYRDGTYAPTCVAVNGDNGDIWVADGYGESYVHRYDRGGNYLGSINGEEGRAGRFATPHAVFVDTRGNEPELYISDRVNARVQVYDLDGKFKRSFGEEFLTSPSGFVTHGGSMVISELRARLAVVDDEDKLVTYLGDNYDVWETDGWPNDTNEKGEPVPTSLLEPGKFNSPHGMAIDPHGNLYIAEFLIGGRMTKLVKS